MKRRKKYPKVLLLALLLLGTIPLLAVLQYHWLAQLSEADYVRMQANIESIAQRFSQDIDREIMGAHLAFVGARTAGKQPLGKELTQRKNRWDAMSPYAPIIDAVYLIEGSATTSPALYIHDSETSQLLPTSWPSSVRTWVKQQPAYRTHDLPTAATQTTTLVSPIPFSGTMENANPTTVSWPAEMLTGSPYNQLVLSLNTAYIFDTMMPALVAQHFSDSPETGYDVLLTQRGNPNEILYRSTPSLTVDAFAGEDFSMNIGIPDQPQIVSLFSELMGDKAPFPPQSVLDFFRKGFQLSRLSGNGLPATMGMNPGNNGGFMPVRTWQLYVKHKAGPLDQIVTQTRNRNLWISFAVLLILGLSIVLIIVYTRRMQQLADQQMAFVAGVSHELRTPLAIVHAAGENLQDGLITDQEETQDYGKLIVDESRSLLNTIEQVLAYAGISFGHAPPMDTAVDVNALIRQIITEYEVPLKSFDVQLQLDAALPTVRGDREALHTVLQNLVQNAIKYANGQKWLTIQSRPSKEKVAGIELVFEDRGIGIEPSEQASIFEPFYRTPDVRKTQIRGNGLGLSIARQIIEAHGGNIRVSSTPARGSTFYVTLAQTPPNVTQIP